MKAEAPVFWSSGTNRRLIRKLPDVGEDQGQKGKRVSEGEIVKSDAMNISSGKFQEMVRDREAWHATVSLWGHKELDVTGRWNKLINIKVLIM